MKIYLNDMVFFKNIPPISKKRLILFAQIIYGLTWRIAILTFAYIGFMTWLYALNQAFQGSFYMNDIYYLIDNYNLSARVVANLFVEYVGMNILTKDFAEFCNEQLGLTED